MHTSFLSLSLLLYLSVHYEGFVFHFGLAKPFPTELDCWMWLLSHVGDNAQMDLVAYHSRKFDGAEMDYEIHDEELLAVVDSFEEYRVSGLSRLGRNPKTAFI